MRILIDEWMSDSGILCPVTVAKQPVTPDSPYERTATFLPPPKQPNSTFSSPWIPACHSRTVSLGQFEVKAIAHIIRSRVSRVYRFQPKGHFAEFHQAHMRMQRLGNSPLGVRTDHQAPDPRPIAELGIRITRSFRRAPSRPLVFQRRRIDVVVTAAPIVPGNKDHRVRPSLALSQFVDAVRRPLAPQLHGLLPGVFPIGRVLGKLHGTARRV